MHPPLALSLVAMVCFGVAGIIDKVTMAGNQTPTSFIMLTRLLPMIAFWGIFVMLPGQRPDGEGLPWRQLGLAALSATLAGALGMWTYLTAIRQWDASRVIAISSSYPALCAILAWLFLGESITPSKIAGIAAITVGIWLTAR